MTKPVVLISTYELGRQPFALAAAAALLRDAGAVVQLQDLSVSPLDEQAVSDAALVALYVPMHTAARLTQALLPRLRRLTRRRHTCASSDCMDLSTSATSVGSGCTPCSAASASRASSSSTDRWMRTVAGRCPPPSASRWCPSSTRP